MKARIHRQLFERPKDMKDIRIGYHYTSLENWKVIQRTGLRPYVITKPQLFEYFGTSTVKGIWVWRDKPNGLAHVGCVIYQMATKAAVEAVLLEVQYNVTDLLRPPGVPNEHIILPHQGTIANLEYHDSQDIGLIVTKPIQTRDIKLLRTYNLLDAWGGQ